MSDDFISLLDDEPENIDDSRSQVEPWVIGIIDDEPSVHAATELALRGVTLYDRPLKFVKAYSAKEGFELIKDNPNMAVVLLDVVMETSDAGLLLVDRIRSELENQVLQIVLRTGQAGYAPEEDVIVKYEINSYKTKSELTRQKLFTAVATALRSFQQLETIENSRNGLRSIIKASAMLMQERAVYEFSSGVLEQIDALFDLGANSMFCVSQRPSMENQLFKQGPQGYYVVAANTKYKDYYGKDITTLRAGLDEMELACKALEEKKHQFNDDYGCVYLSTPAGWEGVIATDNTEGLTTADQELLQLFCMNVALGLENAKYFSYLNQAAFNDELTGLHNRTGFIQEGMHYLARADKSCSLYLIDIDYFHEIITSLGYEFGNTILNKFADVIKELYGHNALVARIHADVFAVLTYSDTKSAHEVAVQCSRPMLVDGQSIRLGLTVGLCRSDMPCSTNDVANMLRQAELALHVAKTTKRGSGQNFDESYEVESRKSMTILSDLRLGFEKKELFLVLQPKVDMKTAKVVGYESLIRWRHPEKGMIPPGAFLTSVEKSGMYYDLDMYVANHVCEIVNANPDLSLPISFNVSANSLNHEAFVGDLIEVFNKHKVSVDKVQVEITENALIHSDQSILRLQSLSDHGFVICLDDFGAGFSSLGYLLNMPLDVIKIDRIFLADIVSNTRSYALLKGIVSIIKELDKQIVVEGVETEEQRVLLQQIGLVEAQGFLFHRPLPVDEAVALASK
ncbi:EAL domain-containing protein [Alteromonas sp. KUL49]|uniref:GGDEF/EAL domain-containing response regulator n=1 Tax=Alteromonas sp. KUL49 TaxID=2480798 RepID=UPI00102F11DF|nr:EAL domain-containing protein [Alteromonas sp. KUL49]TAP34942.1 EAL domain-containing protein [Alteromonas sp. KUL49]GEA13485.1 diguanylate cyclase [Alteromonas sp. KUL49]